jgi:phosphoribosylformylglycinamidine cyclo-ligase
MLKTFNCGIGMTIVCAPDAASGVVEHLAGFDMAAYAIGEIVAGAATVGYRGGVSW